MGFAFDRPVGAASDVMELEFVSALLQTSDKLRLDGSIQGLYLHSSKCHSVIPRRRAVCLMDFGRLRVRRVVFPDQLADG
jgi:hypothetical protein